MSIDSIVNRLANVQQRLHQAPLTRTRNISDTLDNLFTESMRAEISSRDREEISSRWTSDYKIEDINHVFQVLLPYCTAQTKAWHSGADNWENEDKETTTPKRHCPAGKSSRAFFVEPRKITLRIFNSKKQCAEVEAASAVTSDPHKIKLRLSNPKKQCAQTEPLKDIMNVPRDTPSVPKGARSTMKPMNFYTQYPPNITVRRIVRIDPEVAKKTAEILRTDGFKREEKRDLNYELMKNLTIAEAQGSSSFCNKIVEHAIQTPSVLSPSYLRTQELVNRELSLELRYKRLGHAFSLKGMVALPNNKQACLEGASESFVLAMLRDTFDKFADVRKDIVSREMSHAISESLSKALWHDNATDEKINEVHGLIHNRSYPYPVCVGSGYVWHSTQVLFFSSQGEDFLAYCNRGEGCNQASGILIYKIEHKNKITPEFLKRITSRLSVQQTEYTTLEKIKEELGATHFIYQGMKEQKSGNCVYASAKASIFALFLVAASRKTSRMPILSSLDIVKNARQLYKEFTKFDKEIVLDDFLIDIEDANRLSAGDHTSYLQGLNTVAISIRNWAMANKGRNKVDEDLLGKTLRLLSK